MQDLKITLVQSDLVWENCQANLAGFENHLSLIKEQTDLIILPEMFSSGFSMNGDKNAEEPEGKAFQWMKEKAVQFNCVVIGSILTKENNQFYNRLIWMQPDGNYQTYNKRHLFRLADEHLHFSDGKVKLITALKGWKICPLICYDLRFPVWSKNTLTKGVYEYDLLIYIASWPERRSYQWKQLLIARAIENMAYVAGVNRIGKDGHQVDHTGDSILHDFSGLPISNVPAHQESVQTFLLNYNKLQEFREHFSFGNDWDKFSIQNT